MRTVNHLYNTPDALIQLIAAEPLFHAPFVLLQIFSGSSDAGRLSQILDVIASYAPHVKVIGTSTSGEIYEGKRIFGTILLSFSGFEHTSVSTHRIALPSYEAGVAFAREHVGDQSRCMICFGESLRGNAEPFLKGIASVRPDLVIAGGNAADNDRFESTFVIEGDSILSEGAVAAVLDNPQLEVYTSYALNWVPVSKTFTVTKVDDNRVYELDGTPMAQICRYYLGDEVMAGLPASIIEFPLLKEVEGALVARSIVAVAPDGAFVYAGSFEAGEKVRFGVGDVEAILGHSGEIYRDTAAHPVESVFIYSCTARKAFLREAIEAEFRDLTRLAPVAGFFTYGEYYHTGTTNQILNITTTLLALSERSVAARPDVSHEPARPQSFLLRALTHLVNITTKELNESVTSLSQYKYALDVSAIVSTTDRHGIITYVNPAFEAISGFSAGEALGRSHNIVRHPDMPKAVFFDLWKTIAAKRVWKGIIKNRSKEGNDYYVDSVIVPILDSEGEIGQFISIRHDVTKLITQEQIITQQTTDPLTGLPNRTKLLSDIEEYRLNYLAIINIDRFKNINDLYGFDIADELLVLFAQRLMAQTTANNLTVYRIYGDEFAVTSEEPLPFETFDAAIRSMVTILDKTAYLLNGIEIAVGVSAGVGVGEERLVSLAELSLQKSREEGRIYKPVFADSVQTQRHIDNLGWINKIRDAIADGRIVNYYQPIVNPHDPQEKKYEALVRLIDEEGNVVAPAKFLDVAKQTRYYADITRLVLAGAIEAAGRTRSTISVNVSVEDIDDPVTLLQILATLEEHPEIQLDFEITETEAIGDYTAVMDFIHEAKRRGSKIAIDDFGSGYSNFSYLITMEADYLKIDGSIISKVLTDTNSRLVTESIVDIGRKLGIKTVAEFVSSKEIAECLVAIGVDYLQGYYLGEPGPL